MSFDKKTVEATVAEYSLVLETGPHYNIIDLKGAVILKSYFPVLGDYLDLTPEKLGELMRLSLLDSLKNVNWTHGAELLKEACEKREKEGKKT